jgi:hypothetical protein
VYVVAFTKVFTMYLIYPTWIWPSSLFIPLSFLHFSFFFCKHLTLCILVSTCSL